MTREDWRRGARRSARREEKLVERRAKWHVERERRAGKKRGRDERVARECDVARACPHRREAHADTRASSPDASRRRLAQRGANERERESVCVCVCVTSGQSLRVFRLCEC